MDKSTKESDYRSTLLTFKYSHDFYGIFFSWCSGFAWDSDGDLLAIISQSQLYIWDANTSKKQAIDVGLRDVLTCLLWSKTGPLLAVGTAKGNLSIYNHNTSK